MLCYVLQKNTAVNKVLFLPFRVCYIMKTAQARKLFFSFFFSTGFALGFILESEYSKMCNLQTSFKEFLFHRGDRANILCARPENKLNAMETLENRHDL